IALKLFSDGAGQRFDRGSIALLLLDQEAALIAIAGPQPVDGPAMTAPPPYADMIAASAREGRTPTILVAGDPRNAGNVTSVNYTEAGLLSSRAGDVYRNDGTFLAKVGGQGSTAGERAFGMVSPLHYGTFGGYPIKFAYGALALALTYVTSTGMMIWFRRRAQQARPVPRWEAAWRGMTTGLSFALTVATIVTASGGGDLAALVTFTLWPLTAATIATRSDPLAAVRAGYLLIAGGLALAIVISMITHPPVGLAAPWLIGVDIAMAALSIGFLFAWLKLRRPGEVPGADAAAPVLAE
ncbi:MAG: PepSY-associated TM helix domain-containing protein, partial [Pseudomonadota bacterium]